MTREEAKMRLKNFYLKKLPYCDMEDIIKIEWYSELIDEIYNDFDNRICKNCIYFKKQKNLSVCSNVLSRVNLTEETFGCNKFKKR